MKQPRQVQWWAWVLPAGWVLLSMLAVPALAAEGGNADWRPTYDLIMRWVNFLILAFLLVKFGRVPIMNFLNSQKERVARDIESLEAEKNEALARLNEIKTALSESQARYEKLTDRIVRQGERKRQAIIEEARRESRVMMEDARRRADFKLMQAQQALKAQLVDNAVNMVLDRLPAMLTNADQQKYIDNYLTATTV